jgi:hypothetical protein
MAFYNRINDFYTLVGNNVASKTNESIDAFLNSLADKYSNAGLILNYIKNSGVSGSTDINDLLSNSQYFNILNEALRLAKLTDRTDFYEKLVKDNSLFTEENKFSLLPNDVVAAEYTGGTASFTTLVESKESRLAKDFTTIGVDGTGKGYRLVGQVVLNEPNENFYIIPLGLLTVNSPANYQFVLGPSRNNVQAIETVPVQFEPWNISTPLGANCLVTNANNGFFTPADIAFVYADNNQLSSDDYELFLVVVSQFNNINSTIVTIDQEIIIGVTTDNLNDVNITFTNV